VTLATASRAARHLARWRDPEAPDDAHRLNDQADLLDLLGAPRGTEAAVDWVDARWRRGAGRAGLPAVIGTASTGPVRVDLVADGPHALIGGTTGSGKSELLRTLVLSLALTHPPEAVTFVLIDYKGGSAFDVCAALPHVVGLVTDLDERLAHRALRSLDAELRRRERILRRAGAEDLADHRDRFEQGQVDRPPPPRLVVVIDEFATLARDAPGFLDALVGVAQRGRSLGIHLVLATASNDQPAPPLAVAGPPRPSTCHRPDAAQLDRRRPGRALVRIGGDDPVAFQVARVTDRTPDLGASPTPVQDRWLVPVDDWGRPGSVPGCPGPHLPPEPVPGRSVPRPTAFERAVATVGDAHRRRAGAAPRRPWMPPLPTDLSSTELSRYEHYLKHERARGRARRRARARGWPGPAEGRHPCGARSAPLPARDRRRPGPPAIRDLVVATGRRPARGPRPGRRRGHGRPRPWRTASSPRPPPTPATCT
jgi:S-DNA-T family DNA segregation ATPase FtsK/SpoIIIE